LDTTWIPGKSEIEQLDLIFKLVGSPNEEKWPGYSELPNAGTIKWKNNPKTKVGEARCFVASRVVSLTGALEIR
jgi:hypothetical protein